MIPANARDTQHIALLVIALADARQRLRLHVYPALAMATRCVSCLAPTSTICAWPAALKCVSSDIAAGFRRRLSGVVNLDNRIIESRSVDRKLRYGHTRTLFASLRERLDVGNQDIAASAASTVSEVWQRIVGDTAPPANMLVAVNMEYADMQAPVRDGDEVAFFRR